MTDGPNRPAATVPMASSDDAWEAVFALAGRSVDDSNDSPEPRPEPANDDGSSRKKKKRRKGTGNKKKAAAAIDTSHRPLPAGRSAHDDAAFQAYLKQRSSTRISWPSWMVLREGFDPRCCGQWSDNRSSRASAARRETDRFSGRCSECHQSPFRHVACAGKGSGSLHTPSQQLFVAARNLRCIAVQLALHDAAHNCEPFDVPANVIERLCGEWSHSAAKLQTLRPAAPESLLLACQQVHPRILRVHALSSPSPPSGEKAFEQVIRLMISLDNVYFRLYYSHVSGELPFDDACLPHPLSYFGLVAVDMEAYERLAHNFFTSLPPAAPAASSSNETMRRLLFDRFGLAEGGDGLLQFEHPVLPEDGEPALAMLHRFRTLETIALFQVWSNRPSTRRQLADSCRAVAEDPHETPAPEILMGWRDSCRDFLCHLYCYATLSRATLARLRFILLEHKVDHVLELGAGTGYLARLLDEHLSGDGVSVEAIDLHPPCPSASTTAAASNEYHGSTPPFFSVVAGSESTIVARRRNGMSRTAMLLCYPPPDSQFAFDASRHFTHGGGRLIVFVGEFKGLTGDAKFERFLRSEYACIDRLPCMCWGTDASTVTIWARGSSMANFSPSSLLLPCSFCGDAESTKRCRLLRCLSYCSRRCFDSHATHREALLKLVMVRDGSGLDFDSSHHFMQLPLH